MTSSTPKKNSKMDRGQNIQVFARVRPINDIERASRTVSIVDTPSSKEIVVKEKAVSASRKFTFDRVFGEASNQVDVYSAVVRPLISQVLQGYNCTVFAYGQTGTGKTYTMEGCIGGDFECDNSDAGIIPRSLRDLFNGLRKLTDSEFSLKVSFLELYNEEIFDLLSCCEEPVKLRLYEDAAKKGSVIIQNLEEIEIKSESKVYSVLQHGSQRRQTASTLMNATSSRSHTLFTITVMINQTTIGGEELLRIGKLNLVDLAGSENIGRSGAVDKRAREAGNINQSLLTLGRVITSLVDRTPHIPYRESKLTRLLQDSLGGRTKTSIIATVSPAGSNLEETISTLDYAHRAKVIKNNPEINQKISKKEKLKEYTDEISRLKLELNSARERDGVHLPKEIYDELVEGNRFNEQEIGRLTEAIQDLEDKKASLEKLFQDVKLCYEETLKERDSALENLCNTQVELRNTTEAKEEQAHLVSCHLETENKISAEANHLLIVSDQTTRDLKQLHSKLDEKRNLENRNWACIESYRSDLNFDINAMQHDTEEFLANQTLWSQKIDCDFKNDLKRRCQERNNIAIGLKEDVNCIVETIDAMEKAATEAMLCEQNWTVDQTNSIRNQTDTQIKNLSHFLSNTILPTCQSTKYSLDQLGTKIQNLEADKKNLAEELAVLQSNFVKHATESSAKALAKTSATASSTIQLNNKNIIQIDDTEKRVAAINKVTNDFKCKVGDLINGLVSSVVSHTENISQNGIDLQHNNLENTDRMATLLETIRSLDSGLEDCLSSTDIKIKDANSRIQPLIDMEIDSIKALRSEAVNSTNSVEEAAEKFVHEEEKKLTELSENVKTEFKLRSNEAATNLESLKNSTKVLRNVSLDCYKRIESDLETQIQCDESTVSDKIGSVMLNHSKSVLAFGNKFKTGFIKIRDNLVNFVSQELQKDVPTGTTPVRVNRYFPNKIHVGTPDEQRLDRFRIRRQSPENPDHVVFHLNDDISAETQNYVNCDENGSKGMPTNEGDISRESLQSSDSRLSDQENREPFSKEDGFVRPAGHVGRQLAKRDHSKSKLKQPEIYGKDLMSEGKTRASSRSRERQILEQLV